MIITVALPSSTPTFAKGLRISGFTCMICFPRSGRHPNDGELVGSPERGSHLSHVGNAANRKSF